jgi:hypothetical protein
MTGFAREVLPEASREIQFEMRLSNGPLRGHGQTASAATRLRVVEVTYVLKANSPEEAESIIRWRLRRGPYGYVPHAAWRIDVKKGT